MYNEPYWLLFLFWSICSCSRNAVKAYRLSWTFFSFFVRVFSSVVVYRCLLFCLVVVTGTVRVSHELCVSLTWALWAWACFLWISARSALQWWIIPEIKKARGRRGAAKWPRDAADTRGLPAPPRPPASSWWDRTSAWARRSAVEILVN